MEDHAITPTPDMDDLSIFRRETVEHGSEHEEYESAGEDPDHLVAAEHANHVSAVEETGRVGTEHDEYESAGEDEHHTVATEHAGSGNATALAGGKGTEHDEYESADEHIDLTATEHGGYGTAASRTGRSGTEHEDYESAAEDDEQTTAAIDPMMAAVTIGDNLDGEETRTEVEIDPQVAAEMLERAEAFKAEGNALYSAGDYDGAASKYRDAIESAPPRIPQLAIYFSNMAACDLALKCPRDAVTSCSSALEIDPGNNKALMRRSVAYEELGEQEAALKDAKKLLELTPGNAWAVKAVSRLEPLVQQRQEEMKTQMLGQLKDLGNTLLGKFGLSLDNFKADKDPATGSYSIRFEQ